MKKGAGMIVPCYRSKFIITLSVQMPGQDSFIKIQFKKKKNWIRER